MGFSFNHPEKQMTTNNSDSVNDNSAIVNHNSQDIYTLMTGQDGTEFVVSDKGIPYASIRATARMLGVDKKSIRSCLAGEVASFRGGGLNPVTNAKIVTPGGIQGGHLLDSDTVYSLACHYNPKLAFAMGIAGAAVYMLKQAGYRVKAIETEPVKPVTELTRLEILELALESEKKALALAAQIEADSARTALGAAIEAGNEHIRIGEMAKQLGMGQNKYFEELRECKIIMASGRLPYQHYMKYFKVTQVQHNGNWYQVALINSKGQAYLAKRHQKHLNTTRVVDQAEMALESSLV